MLMPNSHHGMLRPGKPVAEFPTTRDAQMPTPRANKNGANDAQSVLQSPCNKDNQCPVIERLALFL